jgi:hypothetical protein
LQCGAGEGWTDRVRNSVTKSNEGEKWNTPQKIKIRRLTGLEHFA